MAGPIHKDANSGEYWLFWQLILTYVYDCVDTTKPVVF